MRLWLRKNLMPLKCDSDTTLEHWLEGTNYPEWRKKQLREASLKIFNKSDYNNKSFIKREFYPEPKHARWINSRSDKFKSMTGPIFHLIESETFKNSSFVKYSCCSKV
mgnify:FL=1